MEKSEGSPLRHPDARRSESAGAGPEGNLAEFPAVARKREPTHPGEFVRLTLDNLRLSLRAAASAINVTPSALANVVGRKSAVTPDMALRLGKFFGNGPELWLGMQADYDLWHARLRLKNELARIRPAKDEAA